MMRKIYDQGLQILNWTGEIININQFKGEKLLIVNTASLCKLANNSYAKIKKAMDKDTKMNVLLCPCDQFLDQEHKQFETILADIQKRGIDINSGRVFVTEKMHVKGEKIHPLYQFLTAEKHSWIIKNQSYGILLFSLLMRKVLLKKELIHIHFFRQFFNKL